MLYLFSRVNTVLRHVGDGRESNMSCCTEMNAIGHLGRGVWGVRLFLNVMALTGLVWVRGTTERCGRGCVSQNKERLTFITNKRGMKVLFVCLDKIYDVSFPFISPLPPHPSLLPFCSPSYYLTHLAFPKISLEPAS